MERMRINITIPEDIWRKFKKLLIDKNETFSGRVTQLIKKDLEEHKIE